MGLRRWTYRDGLQRWAYIDGPKKMVTELGYRVGPT